jgi:hypothetical protein
MADPKSNTEAFTFIYALRDPNTKQIRYVGRSVEPEERLRRHLRNAKRGITAIAGWMRGLQEQRPLLEIIEKCDAASAIDREHYWITQHRSTQDLLNYKVAGPRVLTKADSIRNGRRLFLGDTCKNGHRLTADNTRVRPDRRNVLVCMQCQRDGRRRFTERNPVYDIWSTMIRRTTDPNFKDWYLYGGHNPPVTICKRWLNSYADFVRDVGPRPSLNHSLDRINGKKGYSPANCRWATVNEQMRNMRHNRPLIAHDGLNLCLAEWAERVGLKYMTLFNRVVTLAWPVAKALTTPLVPHGAVTEARMRARQARRRS